MRRYKDNFLIVRMPNPTIGLVKTIVRENCLLNEVEYVFYDYIFSSPSLINQFSHAGIREDRHKVMSSKIAFPSHQRGHIICG